MFIKRGVFFLSIVVLFFTYNSIIAQPNDIDKSMKEEIKGLVAGVVQGMEFSKPDEILKVCHDSLKRRISRDLPKILDLYRNTIRYADYKVLNDFHLENAERGNLTQVGTGRLRTNDFFFTIVPYSNEVFIEIGYFELENEQKELTTVWEKHDGKWLLCHLHIGLLSLGGHNAVEWYHTSKENYEKGYFCDAAIKLMLVTKLLAKNALPFTYVKEGEIKSYGRKVSQQLMSELKLPLKVTEISTSPCLFKIRPKLEHNLLIPEISYVTSSDIKDMQKIERECNDLHKKLGNIYPEINLNNKKIIYQVFEHIPQTDRWAAKYTFIREFK